MPIRLWVNYSKLFKSISRITQMSLFTHLNSFLPISPSATVQNHLFWVHGQPASPCRASTHFFYRQSLWSTPWGPSGPDPSTISWATRRLSQLSLLFPTLCMPPWGSHIQQWHISNIYILCKIVYLFSCFLLTQNTILFLILQKEQTVRNWAIYTTKST